jgi:subtilase family serine protease
MIYRAYDLSALYCEGIDGRGQTIVIVDSFGSPTIRRDLGVFDARFHLPAPPSLRVIAPVGPIPQFNPASSDMVGWAGESSLDVEWAHAIAPRASIVLVETPVSETEGRQGFPQIVRAEQYVLDHHLGTVISQSFGATEQTFGQPDPLAGLRSAYVAAARAGVTVLAASGDFGSTEQQLNRESLSPFRVTSWPASDPLVTGVGGTRLILRQDGSRAAKDVVWNDQGAKIASGGGLSVFFRRPAYQDFVAGVVGTARGVPDISMVAAGSMVYVSAPGDAPGWLTLSGTSAATALFAGIVALAAQVAGHRLGPINPALYQMSRAHARGLLDVVTGNNTVSFTQGGKRYTVHGFAAHAGSDLASGVGTVGDAALFVPELARFAG